MQTIKQINQILDDSNSLKMIAQAYSEIAAIKLQKIRTGIERNRRFFQEVSDVFQVVQGAAAKKHIYLPTRRGGTVSLLLTSNQRFYGGLETVLTKFFIVHTSRYKTERIVIGKTGQEFLTSMHFVPGFKGILFQKDLPQFGELKAFIDSLSQYQQIFVYYPRMESVLVQGPRVVDIIPKMPASSTPESESLIRYIFEPDISTTLAFFNNQIITLLLEQTFLESELARTAARLISMDQAQIRADKFIKDEKTELAQSLRDLNNRRLLEAITMLSRFRRKTRAEY